MNGKGFKKTMSDSQNQLILFKSEKSVKEYRGFLPSVFISASLPLRDVKSPYFKRKYNNIELYLTGAPKVPYGKYARLLLAILTTHAVLSEKDETVIEYRNLSQLLNELQLPKQRGNDVKEQLELFSLTSFQYKEKIERKVQGNLFEDMNDSSDYIATWNNHGNIPFMKSIEWIDMEKVDTGEKRSYEFRIRLSSEFTQMCREHAVPIDYTVYSKINSALGKDLYAWFIYRNNFLKDGEELYISKEKLLEQFMPVGNDVVNVTAQRHVNYSNICERITEIKTKYYPELKVSFAENGGIRLRKSPSVIIENDRRYILVTN